MSVIDEYLETLAPEQRELLSDVRTTMHAVLAQRNLEAEEVISYGLPCLKVAGKAVGGFAANKNFCSYYPFSGTVLGLLKPQLLGYSQTKSALHFTISKPLTPELIDILVVTRLRQIIG